TPGKPGDADAPGVDSRARSEIQQRAVGIWQRFRNTLRAPVRSGAPAQSAWRPHVQFQRGDTGVVERFGVVGTTTVHAVGAMDDHHGRNVPVPHGDTQLSGNGQGMFLRCVRKRDVGHSGLTEVGVQLTVALGFHINTFTYGLSGPQIAILAVALLLSAIVAQPMWIKGSKRYDKKPARYAAIALAAVGLVGAPLTHVAWQWFPLEPSAHLVLTLLPFQILAGLGN